MTGKQIFYVETCLAYLAKSNEYNNWVRYLTNTFCRVLTSLLLTITILRLLSDWCETIYLQLLEFYRSCFWYCDTFCGIIDFPLSFSIPNIQWLHHICSCILILILKVKFLYNNESCKRFISECWTWHIWLGLSKIIRHKNAIAKSCSFALRYLNVRRNAFNDFLCTFVPS